MSGIYVINPEWGESQSWRRRSSNSDIETDETPLNILTGELTIQPVCFRLLNDERDNATSALTFAETKAIIVAYFINTSPTSASK